MYKIWHGFIGYAGFCIIPIIWAGLNATKHRTTFKELYIDWNKYRKSGESWGAFD